MRGGPKWSEVVRRITFEAETGLLILDEEARHISRAQESAPIGKGYYDITTMLVYKKAGSLTDKS